MSVRDILWRLEPHVCRTCFGRIVSRPTDTSGERLYRCSNCGGEAVGATPSVLCSCGLTVRKAARNGAKNGGTQVDAGIRCVKNPSRTELLPCEFVAMEVPA